MRILFAIYSRSQWTLPREITRRLVAAGDTVDVVWFGPLGAAELEIAAQVAQLGCRFYAHETYNGAVAPTALTSPLIQVNPALLQDAPLPVDHPYRILVRRQISGAQVILREAAPDLVVVCEDGPGGDNALIEAARCAGLSVLVVPFGIGESHDYDLFLADKAHEGCLNRVPDDAVGRFLFRHGRHWIRSTAMGEVLLFPAEFTAARLLEGLDLPRPWAVQGGNADKIAVESPAMMRHFEREQTPEHKLSLVGTVYCDVLGDVFAQDADKSAAYQTQKPIRDDRVSLLISLPPSFDATRATHSEFARYEDMCEALLLLCTELEGVDVTVSVHPNSDAGARAAIERTGVRISSQWLVSLIAQHDIFLTTFSSTIRWAIVARKPVVNYDMYAFELPTYRDVPGVSTVRTLAGVEARLRALCGDLGAFREAAQAQRRVAADWGCPDRENFVRLRALMTHLVDLR